MTAAYSSALCPLTFTITGVLGALSASHARSRVTNASTPGFCRPIEFSMPLAVSAMRGLALPAHGSSETPLVTIAPRRARSTKSANSRPEANVPDAVITGIAQLERADGERSCPQRSLGSPPSASATTTTLRGS